MKSQKCSIKDFFKPTPRDPLANANNSALAIVTPTGSTVQIPQPKNLTTSHTPRSKTPVAVNKQSPSPASQCAVAAPAPTIQKATGDEAQAPVLSQASANSGASKRVVSNGEHVVLNSDSDTDSLPDLDWGIPTIKSTTTAIVTRSRLISDDEEDGLRKPAKRVKSDRRSFNLLIAAAQKNLDTELSIAQRKADLDRTLDNPNNEDATANTAINEHVLGQVVQGSDNDPERAHRLLLAIQRTNAVQPDKVFNFFEDTSDSIFVQQKFPYSSLPNHRWAFTFEDVTSRDQAFSTGFAQQIFRLQKLPDEVASWMVDQICSARNELLNSKYLEILKFHHGYFEVLLNETRLNTIFRSIGIDTKSLSEDIDLVPSSDYRSAQTPRLPVGLRSVAKLLESAAPWLQDMARNYALYTLCHICLDHRVIADAVILRTIQDAIEALICNFADNSKLTSALHETIPRLLSRITHPNLQRDLVCSFPTQSPLTAYLQRQLALSFFLYPVPVDILLADPRLVGLVHTHLQQSPYFQIKKDTDYSQLTARLTLLDIGIGPGLLSVPYKPLFSPRSSRTGLSPDTEAFPTMSEVKDFNKEIDALAQHVKLLGNSIVEIGAAVDLTILDAKDSVERLCSRLQHAARIGGKKVHNVFGNDDEEKIRQVDKFFFKVKSTPAAATAQGVIFDDQDDAEVVDDTASRA